MADAYTIVGHTDGAYTRARGRARAEYRPAARLAPVAVAWVERPSKEDVRRLRAVLEDATAPAAGGEE
jgi:hypothetical protein